MVTNAWLRPKTSSGLPNNDSSSGIAHSSSASHGSASDAASLCTASSASARSPSVFSTATTSTNVTNATFPQVLSTRRSTHEFFQSSRDVSPQTVSARPRPSSSYLPSFTAGGSGSSKIALSDVGTQTGFTHQPRNRFKTGIDEARGVFSAMARKALQGGGGSRDARPVDRLSTHDSFATSPGGSSGVVGMDTNGNASSSTVSSIPPARSNSSVSSYSRPLQYGGSSSRSVRRFRSLRDKAHPRRVFHSLVREHSHHEEDESIGDAPPFLTGAGEHMPQNSSSTPSFAWQNAPGSAARAAAAEHNHSKASHHHHHSAPDAALESLQHDLSDEEMSDDIDMRLPKKRRGGKGKFSPIAEDIDMLYAGYDSMEADNGVDEFTDRRRSKPPARTDLVGKLPTEIAAGIISYLDDTALTRCLRVSRRWNEVASSSPVWRSSFLGRYARANENVLPYIQFGGQGLGRRANQPQEWQRMCAARRKIEKNWKAMQPKAIYFVGHTDSVYCCQFDEDKIITGSRDRTIRVWDLNAPYKCRKVIGGPAARPVRPASDTTLDTHPTNTVHQTRSLNGTPEGDAIFYTPSDYHTASILCLQFDREIMVTGSSDYSCIVWDINTFEPIRRLIHHTAGVLDVCMDDQYIISCSKDAHICVWDRKTFTLIKALHGHRGPVNAVQLREINGRKLLVSASGDGLAKIWDLGQLQAVRQFNSQDRGLAAVEFSDDGRFVLAGGNDQVIYKFDAHTTELVHTFRGHNSLVRSLFLDSANGRVVSGSYDQGIRVYDFSGGELVGSYDNWTTSWILAAKGDYRRIVATSQDGRALLMDYGWGVRDVELLSGSEEVPVPVPVPTFVQAA